ncbi:2OG-Fe(II) oxygenase [Pseudoxanthomonas spadix]|jgi:prolyl 4-hydroxylase|uniref:Procollagen-proline dioxygenase n=1 Tax=Pseudoxanthomonas spadix (strain BD-a59) TaxID=1045855 RepID=G7UPM0_PSEUP|nr:2OG-Fe(II) oxygenase [Pseudoxanthomonas spadix]AER56833.1 Procollagen-proline dioxygenase [Pseudoxanthomonas spadix BD-a59]MBP3973792.1 2OG-Fe(II) oxygenase [Pseudoxanthomonas spadix]RMW98014.1 2-oxoglutarate-dependent dioxygenase [Pseudoxanthomonas spadix]
MTSPLPTPDLRAWILTQAEAGTDPREVTAAMLAQGWTEQAAIDAVERTMREHLESHARRHGLPVPVPVPAPIERNGPALLQAGDRQVQVLASLLHPRVIVFGNLLAAEECDALIALARRQIKRSPVFDPDTGQDQQHQARTSEGMFFGRGANPLCARVEARIAALLNWPLENGEGLQVLRYGPGAQYEPHYDYFDPARPGAEVALRRGGQRVASLVIYLNTPTQGGATTFPDAHLEVAPIKGNAVYFSYDRPHPMTGTLHGGAPVVEGEKWVATKWLRERRHD